jgi:Ni/Co efflux regulator RcnB
MQAGLEFWAPYVAAIEQESVATAVYAKRHGLALHSLYYWRQKIKAAAQPCGAPERSSAFVALTVSESVLAQSCAWLMRTRTDTRSGRPSSQPAHAACSTSSCAAWKSTLRKTTRTQAQARQRPGQVRWRTCCRAPHRWRRESRLPAEWRTHATPRRRAAIPSYSRGR